MELRLKREERRKILFENFWKQLNLVMDLWSII